MARPKASYRGFRREAVKEWARQSGVKFRSVWHRFKLHPRTLSQVTTSKVTP